MQRKRIQTKNELLRNNTSSAEPTTSADGTVVPAAARFDENEVYPRIHGMVFNVNDGLMHKIPINFKQRVGSLDHIYGLYTRANPIKS